MVSDFIWLSVFSSHSWIQTALVVLDVVSSLPACSPELTDNDHCLQRLWVNFCGRIWSQGWRINISLQRDHT